MNQGYAILAVNNRGSSGYGKTFFHADDRHHGERDLLFPAERIKKPLLVFQGANDPRVLQVESDEIVAAAKKNGVPVEYVVFLDEGHGFARKDNRPA